MPRNAHPTAGTEQVRAYLAGLVWCHEYAIGPPRQQPRKIGLARRQRKLPHVIAIACEHVEGVKLNLDRWPNELVPGTARGWCQRRPVTGMPVFQMRCGIYGTQFQRLMG